ncbi:MAG: hypothetical protein ACI9LM_005008 [Alteromonadaceae bacterium]|jgi:hypothetical protein
MRSRSSLLSHLIGSSEDVIGNSELQISYTNHIKGKIKANQCLNDKNSTKYYFDKILHSGLTQNSSFFECKNCKYIFLIREPESTLKSLVKMYFDEKLDNKMERAHRYYVDRLLFLYKHHQKNSQNYMIINSDDIIYDTKNFLLNISKFLDFKKTLTKNYQITEQTGKIRSGDSSKNIFAGSILNDRDKVNQIDIEIPRHLLNSANKVYFNLLDKI